jgi:hypothetical protein
LIDDDSLFSEISQVFDGKVGTKFSTEELHKIYLDGKKRYEKKIPPGFKDQPPEKQEPDCYGDLVIWKEIIEKVKNTKSKGIIFVTDDSKEDWWDKRDSGTLGPRPELGFELFEETGAIFYAYNSSRFLQYAKDHIKLEKEINQKSIDEIKLRSDYMSNILVQNTISELTKSLNLPSIAQQLQILKDENEKLRLSSFEEIRRSLVSSLQITQPSSIGIAEALQNLQRTIMPLLPNNKSDVDKLEK